MTGIFAALFPERPDPAAVPKADIAVNTPYEAWAFCGGGKAGDELAVLVLAGKNSGQPVRMMSMYWIIRLMKFLKPAITASF